MGAASRGILALFCTLFAVVTASFHLAFQSVAVTSRVGRQQRIASSTFGACRSRCLRTGVSGWAKNGAGSDDDGDIMSSNWLSHAMLRVPDVNATVNCWLERGAKLTSYRKAGQSETAFVTMGNGQEGEESSRRCFSLEVTKLPLGEEFDRGNAISYFGISMLMEFRNNLIGAAAGDKPRKRSREESLDPNGFELKSVASGPGDFFCRLCLRTDNAENGLDMLRATEDFYTKLLGMKTVATDDDLVCLRCPKGGEYGAAVTLVFVKGEDDEPLDHGNCFDHIVVSTKNVLDAAEMLKAKVGEEVIFMEPREMFGMQIMGIKDPNGYSVYLAEMDRKQ